MVRFLFASDSFKGTISSARAAELLADAARARFPRAECRWTMVADGGEGTVDAVVSATGGEVVTVCVEGPRRAELKARYGMRRRGLVGAAVRPLVRFGCLHRLHASSLPTLPLVRFGELASLASPHRGRRFRLCRDASGPQETAPRCFAPTSCQRGSVPSTTLPGAARYGLSRYDRCVRSSAGHGRSSSGPVQFFRLRLAGRTSG